MGLDTDLDLMKIVGGPDFVWGPTVCTTGDPVILDPSEVPDDVLTSLPQDSSLRGVEDVLCDSPPHNSWVKKSVSFASRSMYIHKVKKVT